MRKLSCFIFPIWISLAYALTFAGCHSGGKGSDANAAETPYSHGCAVARGSIVHKLNLAGQFQPYQVIDVHAKVSGYIRHIYVDIGDKVHQGQVLAVLEVPELDAQLTGNSARNWLGAKTKSRAMNMKFRVPNRNIPRCIATTNG